MKKGIIKNDEVEILDFKFNVYDCPYYFKDGKFQKGYISQRAYREIYGCDDEGKKELRKCFLEYLIEKEWVEESKLFRNEAEVKASPLFREIMASLGLK